jgi:hypothetical protein
MVQEILGLVVLLTVIRNGQCKKWCCGIEYCRTGKQFTHNFATIKCVLAMTTMTIDLLSTMKLAKTAFFSCCLDSWHMINTCGLDNAPDLCK